MPRASRERLPWAYVRNNPDDKGIIASAMPPENGDEAALPAFHRRRRFHDKENDETCLFALPLPLILTSLHGIQLRTFALHPIIANCIDQHVWYLSIRRRGPTLVRAPAPSRLAMSRPLFLQIADGLLGRVDEAPVIGPGIAGYVAEEQVAIGNFYGFFYKSCFYQDSQ